MYWRNALGGPVNPGLVFSLRITFYQLLRSTKNIHCTLSFNGLVQLARLARLTLLLELLGTQAKCYLCSMTLKCCKIPIVQTPCTIEDLVRLSLEEQTKNIITLRESETLHSRMPPRSSPSPTAYIQKNKGC